MSIPVDPALNRLVKWLPLCVIALGILLRIMVYMQCRDLIVDEANVARNLFERGYYGLLQPLSYQQFAPPLFLWIEELSTQLFGFSEYALRLYPLLSGIAVMLLFYRLLQQYAGANAIWYPLLLLATGTIYLRYSTEVKQYMPDAMITLALLLLALRTNVLLMQWVRFVLIWTFAGSIAIWLSMPAVFTLAAVAIYYGIVLVQAKAVKRWWMMALPIVLWVLQFCWYYFSILQEQASSGYLQSFHEGYFLFLIPTSIEALMHNWEVVVMKLLGNTGGHWSLSISFHLLCIAVGLVYLVCWHTAKATLLVMPILLMLLAATLHLYSLIPRLTIFSMPLLLTIIAVGLSRLMQTRHVWLQALYLILTVICIANFNAIADVTKSSIKYDEMKGSLRFLLKEKIDSSHLYVHELIYPTFIYYTQIHPQHNNYASFSNAHILSWDTDYTALAAQMPSSAALLYGWQPEGVTTAQVNTLLSKGLKLEKRNGVQKGEVFIFQR